MTHSDETQWIYDAYTPSCVFHLFEGNVVCGKRAVGVYVSADDQKDLRPFCREHAEEASHGDGPTFWLAPIVGPDLDGDYARMMES